MLFWWYINIVWNKYNIQKYEKYFHAKTFQKC